MHQGTLTHFPQDATALLVANLHQKTLFDTLGIGAFPRKYQICANQTTQSSVYTQNAVISDEQHRLELPI
jgi:hypothetical protein